MDCQYHGTASAGVILCRDIQISIATTAGQTQLHNALPRGLEAAALQVAHNRVFQLYAMRLSSGWIALAGETSSRAWVGGSLS